MVFFGKVYFLTFVENQNDMKFEANADKQDILGETKTKYVPAVKAGRSWNGFHNDRGRIVHAVPAQVHNGYWGTPSACNATPGNRSYGWDTTDKEINCPKCLKRLDNA